MSWVIGEFFKIKHSTLILGSYIWSSINWQKFTLFALAYSLLFLFRGNHSRMKSPVAKVVTHYFKSNVETIMVIKHTVRSFRLPVMGDMWFHQAWVGNPQ